MSPEHKQQAAKLIQQYNQADTQCTALWVASQMQNLLREIANAPDQVASVPDDFYNAVANLSVELEELIAETSGVYGLHQNGDPSPWEEILEGGRFERISSLHVVQNLLATRQPKQPQQPEPPAPSSANCLEKMNEWNK